MTLPRRPRPRVYKELGYRQAGMLSVNLAVARPMVKAKGHIVQRWGQCLYKTNLHCLNAIGKVIIARW